MSQSAVKDSERKFVEGRERRWVQSRDWRGGASQSEEEGSDARRARFKAASASSLSHPQERELPGELRRSRSKERVRQSITTTGEWVKARVVEDASNLPCGSKLK